MPKKSEVVAPRKEENLSMLDIIDPAHAQINISPDARVVWVSVDGVCRLRLRQDDSRKLNIYIKDERKATA